MKKLLSVILLLSMVFCLVMSASAETTDDYSVTPRYNYATRADSYLTIVNSNTGVCESYAKGLVGVTKITVVQTIEKHWALGIFFRVDNASWTTTKYTNEATVINRMYNMESGTYRMVTDFTFYYGDQTEKITVYSAEATVA